MISFYSVYLSSHVTGKFRNAKLNVIKFEIEVAVNMKTNISLDLKLYILL
jgi:hypothetical protein